MIISKKDGTAQMGPHVVGPELQSNIKSNLWKPALFTQMDI